MGRDGRTALMYAAMFDRLEMLGLLLEHGARWDHRDLEQRGALDYARAMGAQRTAARLEELQRAARQELA